MSSPGHTFIYHLVEAALWDDTLAKGGTYFPPTYDVDGFTHGTADPMKLLGVANNFYTDIPGEWYCLEMTIDSISNTGVKVVFEGAAPVGDKPADFDGSEGELFPHLYGGISPDAVLDRYPVRRAADGTFLAIVGVTDGGDG